MKKNEIKYFDSLLAGDLADALKELKFKYVTNFTAYYEDGTEVKFVANGQMLKQLKKMWRSNAKAKQ